jgi:hypothetical protein
MYRSAAPGQPSGPDPLLVVPGEGLRGILVGAATHDEVLATFGEDAQVRRHDNGDVFQVDYDYTAREKYEPNRPANWSRPSKLIFEYGLLQAIDVGVYQKQLFTSGGIRIGSTRDEVFGAFGKPCESLIYRGPRWGPSDDIETLRYRWRGIQLAIHHDGRVASFVVFQTRRTS